MTVSVAIIEDSIELAQLIKEHLLSKGLNVKAVANNGIEGKRVIEQGGFDVLLLDLILPNIDGLTLIKHHIPAERAYKVICFSAFGKESILAEANKLGVDYFLIKPVNLDVIFENIIRLADKKEENILDTLFSSRLKGTRYLKDALFILQQSPEKINALTLELYPEIAKKHHVNEANIERTIRHAIDKAWQSGFDKYWHHQGKYTRPKAGELLEFLVRNQHG